MATWIVLGSVVYMHRRELGIAWRCVCAGARVGWEKWVERERCIDDEEEEERETRIVDVKAFRLQLFSPENDGAEPWIDHWRVLNDGEGREDEEEEEEERRSGGGEDGAGLPLPPFTLKESDDDDHDHDDGGNDDGAGACIDQWRDPPVAIKISDDDDDEEEV
jgi:hypothetical protein